MNILVKFETPHTLWTPLLVFDNFYKWFKDNYKEHNITYKNTEPRERSNPSGTSSPHVMTITNTDNNKYIIVSYWDRAVELGWSGNGWNPSNNVDLITSSGVFTDLKFTPFSYTCYNLEFEKLSEKKLIPWKDKESDTLLFRGFLYSERKVMQSYKPEYFSEDRKNVNDYFDELNHKKISLSLNGAGEICNRDMEILCSGSVLLRPKLSQKFHNELIPDYHYISVDRVNNPKDQFDLLLKKYEEIKYNFELLSTISNNGINWFRQNGSMISNVDLLKTLINLEKLSNHAR